jgi:hypothetical protein
VLESDVPEYLVDNALFGDKRYNPHGPAATGTQQRSGETLSFYIPPFSLRHIGIHEKLLTAYFPQGAL